MGHHFIYESSRTFAGVSHENKFIVVRRDFFDTDMELIRNLITKEKGISAGLDSALFAANLMLYPSGYITTNEALKNHKEAYLFEKAVHSIFINKFPAKYATFNTNELTSFKLNAENIISIISIFLTSGANIVCELIAQETTIRLAKKPSLVSSYFTSDKSGATIYAFPVRDAKRIELSPDKLSFFNKTEVFMTLTRDHCYFH